MPAIYAHYSFAKKVYDKLDLNLKRIIDKDLNSYYLGAVGPDPLYYYKPVKGFPLIKQSDKIHRLAMKDLLENTNVDDDLAYILGMICHFTLDTNVHKFIHEIEKTGYSHNKIETTFEKIINQKDGYNYKKYKFNQILKYLKDYQTVAKILEVDKKIAKKAVKDMRLIISFLDTFNPIKLCLIKIVLKIIGGYEKNKDLILANDFDESYRENLKTIEELYETSIDKCVYLINNYYSYLMNKEDLDNQFNYNFEGELVYEKEIK